MYPNGIQKNAGSISIPFASMYDPTSAEIENKRILKARKRIGIPYFFMTVTP